MKLILTSSRLIEKQKWGRLFMLSNPLTLFATIVSERLEKILVKVVNLLLCRESLPPFYYNFLYTVLRCSTPYRVMNL